MAVSVVIPWAGDCPDRAAALRWVRAWYSVTQPDWSIVVAELPAGEWIKARAVMPAVRAADGDVVVVADADVVCEGVAEAVAAVESGEPWAIPHEMVHRLSQAATADFLQQTAAGIPASATLDQPPYQGISGGGIVVAPKVVIQAIPLDPRFVGWG